MKHLKIKETYLIFLIVIGLVSLSLYSTYALFTANTEINDVVSFSTQLTTDSSILEYEMVTVPAGESKIIELNVTNSHTSTIYYGAWYQALTDASNINIGVYTEKNNTPASGTIAANGSATILIGITNNGTSDAILNIGVVGSETSNLNLASNRTLITGEWTSEIIVTDEYLNEHIVTAGETVNLTYTTPEMTQVSLDAGEYKLEVWGAQGGSYNTTYVGGKGGYSYGTLTLTETTNLYVYPGGKGTNGTTSGTFSGGFNGGGQSYSESTNLAMSAGGGASDIRIGTDSLYTRVIVAGGGGGAGSYSSSRRYSGGAGGGENGLAGSQYSVSYPGGAGGSTTSAGNSYSNNTNINSTYYGTPADFGNGGSAKSGVTSISGGGGGWYGGGYAANAGAGGGSGYVYTSSTASNYPSGVLLTSKYYLTDAATIAGDQSFADFDGTTVTGHSGNGAVRISGNKYGTYSIPALFGLNDLNIEIGQSVNLTEGLFLRCENGGTGCSLASTDITDTSTLPLGTHTIYYTVNSANNKKYIYSRTINVIISSSRQTLINLGLESSVKSDTPDFSKTSCSSGCEESTVGIYSTQDDLGTSYYFRGNVSNNFVKFGLDEDGYDMYWRIVRINGDGSIRMLFYGGTNEYSAGAVQPNDAGVSSYKSEPWNNNTYAGYMYGSTSSSTYDGTHSNSTNSTIKAAVDKWYTNNITTDYRQYVVDAIYCNDRSTDTTNSSYTGIGTTTTYYAPYQRLYRNYDTSATPTLICKNANDRFTVNATIGEVSGNDKLTYPIGLLSADEVSFAGGTKNSNNTSFYLSETNGSNYYWTMSPYYFNGSNMYSIYINAGQISSTSVISAYRIRPVISITPDAIQYGIGTLSDPFRLTSDI